MKENYNKILKEVKQVGKIALDSEKFLQIDLKSDGVDVVTQIDKEIELKLHKVISKLFPDDGFWGEENEGIRTDRDYTWYVDPIDGTKYYAAGIPLWSISVARVKKGELVPEFSCIFIPKENSLFYAIKSNGAYLNDKKLELKKVSTVEKTTLAFDFSPSEDKTINKSIYQKLPTLLDNFYRVRFLGVGTLNIVWTAQGFFGCYLKYFQGTKQYNDIVAGLLIAKESGLNIDYQVLSNGLERIIICNKEVLHKVLEVIK